jgi:hypothetical protein
MKTFGLIVLAILGFGLFLLIAANVLVQCPVVQFGGHVVSDAMRGDSLSKNGIATIAVFILLVLAVIYFCRIGNR